MDLFLNDIILLMRDAPVGAELELIQASQKQCN